MKYYQHLTVEEQTHLFWRTPSPFDKQTPRERLRRAVGGLLYTPGSRTDGADIVLEQRVPLLTSMAFCLEDAVGDCARRAAEENTVRQLERLCAASEQGQLPPEKLPLLFVRVKDLAMLERLGDAFARLSPVLTGVILPKVTADGLEGLLQCVESIAARAVQPFYAMPILESEELMDSKDRLALLRQMRESTEAHYDRILNIRVGATDLCGLLGVRREVDTPVYKVLPVAQVLADGVRVFGLGDRYTLSAPVWEYYGPAGSAERVGLERELALDRQNGFLGKTCVHPAQLPAVQAACAVPWELWEDARSILAEEAPERGVLAGTRRNKMNERKPHAVWAEKILAQADVYGVLREGVSRAALAAALEGAVTGD